jgi:5-carboxymethyl-2-hydroxymuconate isomerase
VVRRIVESTPARRARDWCRWIWNVLRFGTKAPRPNERVWVDPARVLYALGGVPVRSGQVIDQWPPADPVPFDDHVHVRFALAHWRDGVSWEDTGAFAYMLDQISRRGRQDGCFDLDDVKTRYRRLDELFETVRREGRLRTMSELDPRARNEDGGILIHIGPAGEPAIGDSGKHRMTIAKVLGLEIVPARIGYVHRDAVPLLPQLRRRR